MRIVRMFVRSGLVTIALMSAAATAKAICRFTRLSSRSDDKPEQSDLSERAVDLGRDLGAAPLRREPPSLGPPELVRELPSPAKP